MKPSSDIVCWDSCVFINYITARDDPPGSVSNTETYVKLIDAGKLTLIASTIVRIEVLDVILSADERKKFKSFLDGGRALEAEVDPAISELAGELRGYYAKRRGLTLSTPDSIHLATAIHYEAAEFNTYDKNDSKGSLGLLPLSGSVAGHKLTIRRPEPGGPLFEI
jgi:predicted nucleic acid-binding protein